MELRLVADSPDATRAVGGALGRQLRAGDVVVLAGELGAGKTCLVQGLAAALGHTGRVTSPTFLLARRLDTEPPVVHADAWRLDRVADVFDLGDELLDDDVVTVLEWGDAVATALPEHRVTVDITIDGDGADDPRVLSVTASGEVGDRLTAARAQLTAAATEG